jgi:hypothetical protein
MQGWKSQIFAQKRLHACHFLLIISHARTIIMASEHNGIWSQEGNADFKHYDTQSNQSARLNAHAD